MRAPTLALALAAVGCAASPMMRAAARGDRVGLEQAIAVRQRAGDLSRDEAVSLAKTVADRDLRVAPAGDAVDRVRDVRPCAREFDAALADAMRSRTPAAAEAGLARIDAHRLDLDDARAFAGDPDGAWRALGARALVRREDAPARRRALVDPDPRVRREAARAARDAADGADLDALSEAARVDPVPIVRSEAVRAIAALPAVADGHVANVLRDLWTSGDDGIKEDVALAWAAPRAWSAGGREALRIVAASDHGAAAIEAAAAILQHRDVDAETQRAAVGQIVRAIESGPSGARRQALAEAPLAPGDLLAAIRVAATDDDVHVRVAALDRLAREGDRQAVGDLEALARPGSTVASSARFALAARGDRRIQAWLEQDLASTAREDRLGAATALAALGLAARAAPLLADEDAAIRVRAACTIVMAARVTR